MLTLLLKLVEMSVKLGLLLLLLLPLLPKLVESLVDLMLLAGLLLISLEEAVMGKAVARRLDVLGMDLVLEIDEIASDDNETGIIDVVVCGVVVGRSTKDDPAVLVVCEASDVAEIGATVVVVVEDVVGTGAMKLGFGVLVCRTLSMQTAPAMAPTETSVQSTKGPPKAAKIDPPQS